jgi:hypothetical protein
MKRSIDSAVLPVLLAACALLAAACTPAVMDLGVYDDDVRRQNEDAGRDAAGEATPDASEPAASSQDADLPPDTEDASGPVSPDPSLEDACDEPAPADGPGCAACGCLTQTLVSDPDDHCFELRAHAPDDETAAYPLPAATEQYVRFTVRAPLRDAHYIRSVQTIIDTPNALRGVKVYEHHANEGSSEGRPEGVQVAKTKLSWGRAIYSWSPGSSSLYLDPTVGIPIQPATWYTLEIHYSGAERPLDTVTDKDSSGVRICATSAAPRFEVSLTHLGTDFTWLGTGEISGTEATGNCASDSATPIYLLALMPPQLDVPGQSMRFVLDRASGKSQEVLYDSLIDRDPPQARPLARLERRDMLTVTCNYSAPVTFSRSVDDESCEVYALQWPAYALSGGASLREGTITSCMQ